MSFGNNLKRMRNNRGMTQGDLEAKSKIRMANISRMERNQTEPNLSTIYKLMEALDCDANSLIFDAEKMSTSGVMKEAFKEAERLQEKDQRLIITIIEKCLAVKGIDTLLKQHMAIIQPTFNKEKRGINSVPYLPDEEKTEAKSVIK